jgi:hypothetical protein
MAALAENIPFKGVSGMPWAFHVENAKQGGYFKVTFANVQ